MEHFGCLVNDRARAHGGTQSLITPEGHVIPLNIRDGLFYMDMHAPNDQEMETLPHVFVTSDSPWDPSLLDDEFLEEEFQDALNDLHDDITVLRDNREHRTDEFGYVRHDENYYASIANQDDDTKADVDDLFYFDALQDEVFPHEDGEMPEGRLQRVIRRLSMFPQILRRTFPDLDVLKPYFGWVANDRIQKTLEKTTQFYRATVHTPFRKHFRTRFPAANVRRLDEWFATDTLFADVPAADDGIAGHGGCTMAQLYAGMKSEFLSLHPMKSEKQVAESLEDFIRKNGAMRGLKSDNAKSEMLNAVKQIQRMYCIDDKQSEPYYQHQNYAERKIQDVKRTSNAIMDRTGCPAQYWLLAMLYVVALFNVICNSSGEIPKALITGEVVDVSPFLQFHFWEEVFVATDHGGDEELARWCYPADSVGDVLTYWVLLNRSKQLVARSNVRSAKDPLFPNRNARPAPPLAPPSAKGERNSPRQETRCPIITSVQDEFDSAEVRLPHFSPEELLGLTFLYDTEDGQKVRAKVVSQVMNKDRENHKNIQFLLDLGDEQLQELISYNELSDLIEDQHRMEETGEMEIFTFREVL
jgi:hypothetical protein